MDRCGVGGVNLKNIRHFKMYSLSNSYLQTMYLYHIQPLPTSPALCTLSKQLHVMVSGDKETMEKQNFMCMILGTK